MLFFFVVVAAVVADVAVVAVAVVVAVFVVVVVVVGGGGGGVGVGVVVVSSISAVYFVTALSHNGQFPTPDHCFMSMSLRLQFFATKTIPSCTKIKTAKQLKVPFC